jgi:hypothetical protein
MHTVNLEFKTEDTNLNLTGTANFRRPLTIERLYIVGLAERRHVPANIIHANFDTIENLNLKENAQKLAKVGLNYIGIQARSNLLLSHSVRVGKNGLQKVQDQLTKFFKALGATSVKFSVVNVEQAISDQNNND